jgi:serine/threonine protein kinase/ERCC4-related helicase
MMTSGNKSEQVIAGYRILRQLGEGGMGRIYLAERNGEQVVLKECTHGDPQVLLREARFLASLKHPRIPRVRTFEHGYMVMEFVEGENFEDHIENLKNTPGWNTQESHLRQVVDWGLQMADVLHYLHSQKPRPIIHRDIKPLNILLRPNGQICLIDFGIARHFKPEKLAQRIKDTCPAGTEGYMAPEFVHFQISDPRCDIYSLGVVIHYWLSGEQPDPEGKKSLTRLARRGDPLWDALVEISEKCRHPEPTKRYQSATELAVALRKLSGDAAEAERLEKPCPKCQEMIRASCRFCPVCGSLTDAVKAADASVAVRVHVEISPSSQQVQESILRQAESRSAASLDHFHLYQKLVELEQDPGFAELVSLDHLPRVEKLPHQIEAVKTALGAMHGYCLLADEVGLGKTIEAGIIIKELRLRGLAERILILTPRDLCSQWQQEMFDKFDEFFLVFGRDVDYSLAWQCDRVIAPYKVAEDRFHRQCILSQKYDLVIMDEAHHLIVEDPRRSWVLQDFARALGARTTYFLMLSATPLHNDLKELHTLLTLLKPGSVGDFDHFKERYMNADDPYKPRNVQELRQRLQSVMIRNTRRRIAELPFPRREACRVSVQLSPQHFQTFRDFRQFVRGELWKLALENPIFRRSLQILVESFHSSPEAFAHACDKFIRSFRKMVPSKVLDRLRDFQRQMTPDLLDAKVSQIANILKQITRVAGNKVLVFTEYEDTADLLYQHLAATGLSVVRYPHEDLDDGGERAMEALRAFQQSAAVMVCAQNASEGLNLQFANCMVNFDLPWDPMKLEQRIGRIQRIGGKPKVFIYNLFLQDTVEQDILDVLEKKIEMFGETIGQVEEILGNLADEESFDQIFLDLFVSEDRDSAGRKVDDLIHRARETSTADQLLDAIFGDGAPPVPASPCLRPETKLSTPTSRPELADQVDDQERLFKTQPSSPTSCPQCGQLTQAGAQYCDACGRRVVDHQQDEGDEVGEITHCGPKRATCPRCGAALLPEARFCDSCGMAQVSSPPSPTGMTRCKGCGARLPAGASFCDQCGEKLEA